MVERGRCVEKNESRREDGGPYDPPRIPRQSGHDDEYRSAAHSRQYSHAMGEGVGQFFSSLGCFDLGRCSLLQGYLSTPSVLAIRAPVADDRLR